MFSIVFNYFEIVTSIFKETFRKKQMITGLIDRLKQFSSDETYTYVQDTFDFNFNGYVLEVFEDRFLFLDDVLGKIQINFSIVKKINYSNRKK